MSGHSKWATIKHKKGAADAARAKVFAKLLRLVEVAAREGGGDVTMNASLRSAVQRRATTRFQRTTSTAPSSARRATSKASTTKR